MMSSAVGISVKIQQAEISSFRISVIVVLMFYSLFNSSSGISIQFDI